MANETRLRVNFTGGIVRNDPLALGGTELESYALSRLPVVGEAEHILIVLDPDGQYGDPEIIYVIGHVANSLNATILRGQEGTTAREHPKGTTWSHAPVASDFALANYGISLDEISDVNLPTQVQHGQAIVYDQINGVWVAGASASTVAGDTSWKAIGATSNPGFQNGWTNYGDVMWGTAGYRKVDGGLVVMRGLVASGTVSSADSGTIFTLPVGYRPERRLIFSTRSEPVGASELRIHEDGTVRAYSGGNSWFSIACTFYVG